MAEDRAKKRPDPDALLAKINKEKRGKLTVFLGAAAGVGKTYTMLEAAHDRLRDGVDVVIGLIETHGRQETEKLAEGLPRIPRRQIEYRGKTLPEMDIDAILVRKPGLVLVDELAHTNVAGSRHVRRYQDVEELLNAGINVYTTLNIQHIESLNDVVAKITGVTVRETVPDSIVEQADQVQLIDIPPEELIKRLKEGKVYVPRQAELALNKFFRPGNINALRELALRFTAYRVDKELNEYMQEHNIQGPWPASERVMVCVSGSPFSAQLVRAARRLARGLQAELLAAHIEIAKAPALSEKDRDRIARNMRLAEELGAKTVTSAGKDLTDEILSVARTYNVTHIVVGKPLHSRLREWLRGGAVVDKLIRKSGGINIHVIQGEPEKRQQPSIKTEAIAQRVQWAHYAGGLLMMGLVTVFNLLWQPRLELLNMAMLYLLPVLLSGGWWGKGPSYVTAIASVLVLDVLFIPPVFSFNVSDIRYVWSFIIFLMVAFVTGGLTERLRREAGQAWRRETKTRALFEFSREIAAVADADKIARQLVQAVSQTLDRSVVVLLPDTNGKLKQVSVDNKADFDTSELAVAVWAYEHKEPTGRSTETLPGAHYLYLPLTTGGNAAGVLGIHMQELLTPEQRRLIEAWAGLAAVALERVYLADKARQAALLVESDQLRTALFNSISHELRTPLASIIGAVSSLLDAGGIYSDQARRELLETVQEGAARMDRLIGNLLDTARLESGMMKLKKDWCDIEDVVGVALRRVGTFLKGRPLAIHIPADIPLIQADFALLEQVLVNLLDNACKYSPPGSEINITAGLDGAAVQITVADRGKGIPEQFLNKIFDKFYRVEQPKSVSGTGLGLAICKGIIEAHGGQIRAGNRPGGGLVISLFIPLGQQPQSRLVPE